jgi:hypothetical protein
VSDEQQHLLEALISTRRCYVTHLLLLLGRSVAIYGRGASEYERKERYSVFFYFQRRYPRIAKNVIVNLTLLTIRYLDILGGRQTQEKVGPKGSATQIPMVP